MAHGAALIVATHDHAVANHFRRSIVMRDGQLLVQSPTKGTT
jgi:ABC-type lipoprotein export system ATPase subunit